MAKEIACFAPCKICGARCAHRVDSAGRVYYRCDGNHDERACGAQVRFGATSSENMIAAARAAAVKEPASEEPARSDDKSTTADPAVPVAKRREFLA